MPSDLHFLFAFDDFYLTVTFASLIKGSGTVAVSTVEGFFQNPHLSFDRKRSKIHLPIEGKAFEKTCVKLKFYTKKEKTHGRT